MNPVQRSTRICLLAILVLSSLPTWAADVYHDNVVIVLDASGSMAKKMRSTGVQKMMAAKQGLQEVLSQIPDTTHIGLLVFSAKNVKDPWVYPLGARDDEKLLDAILRPVPGGGTPLGKYMVIAANRLLMERKAQLGYGTYRLLIVTDGRAQDPEVVDKFTPDIMARGITIDVIGVDMAGTHTLATKVHSYRNANDPASLKRAIAEVFAEVASTDTDATQADAFDVIASIPIEMATNMIAALAISGNRPIGAKARKPAPKSRQQQASAKPAQSQQPASQPAPQSQKSPSSGSGFPWLWLFGFVVLVSIVRRALKGKRRGR